MELKPSFDASGQIRVQEASERKGPVPPYAFDWAPGLPGKWTYAVLTEVSVCLLCPTGNTDSRSQEDKPPPDAPVKVTSASLDFVKASISSGDIPPELGIVNYLHAAKKQKQ